MSAAAERYARALVEAGNAKGILPGLRKDFQYLLDLLEADNELKFIFLSPNFLKEDEVSLFKKVLSGKVQEEFVRFVEILIRRAREKMIYEIHKYFVDLADEAEGIRRAYITTAFPVDEAQKKKAEEKLSAKLKSRVMVENLIDGSVIGGGIIKIGDTVLDGSIKAGLRNMQEELSKC